MMELESQDSSRALLARLWTRRDGVALSMVLSVLGCVAVALMAPISTTIESYLIARQQSRAGLLGHIALLPYASMYTLNHEVCIGIPLDSMGEFAPEDAETCERFSYEADPTQPLSCERLSNVGSANHFPTVGLFHFASLPETCASDLLDVVVVSSGWRTSARQHLRLHVGESRGHWETIQ